MDKPKSLGKPFVPNLTADKAIVPEHLMMPSLAEGLRIPPMALEISRPKIFADTMYSRIVKAISDFEKELKPDEEIGAQLASFGQSVTIAIEDIEYHNPYLIKIHGVTNQGHPCTLLQHMSQVNILLVALKAKGPDPKRIGFKLQEHAKKNRKAEAEEAGE